MTKLAPTLPGPSKAEAAPPFAVLDAADPADRAEWLRVWNDWPGREVSAHPGYVSLFATETTQRAIAAVLRSASGTVLYPLIVREVPESGGSLRDITTPYGYGGPFCWGDGDRAALAARFWPLLERWGHEQRIVSEFARFSLVDEQLLPFPGEVRENRTNVVCRLGRSDDELWESVKPKVRRNVKKARREGVEVVHDPAGATADEFYRVYTDTMRRRDAGDGYYFPLSFFESLGESLAGNYAYFHATHGGRPVSSELVLISAENVYFFLGGTDAEHYDLRPNDLLKYEVMSWANRAGKKHYVLGGGYEEDDGVFRYKRAFAPDGLVPFRVGMRVHDRAAYDRLVGDRRAADPTFFPRYRAA